MKWFKTPMVAFTASILVALALSTAMEPGEIYTTFMRSPPGLVLIGRLMMVYSLVYPATGNSVLALFAAILFNNSMSMAALLSTPPFIHEVYARGRRRGNGRFNRGWRFYRGMIAGLSIFYVAFLGLSVTTMVLLTGPKAFMALEASYVLAAAMLVYWVSGDADSLVPRYREALRRALPAILALIVLSALVEAYEIA